MSAKKQRMHWVYYFGRFIIRLVVLPFAVWRVKGTKNLPETGAFLVISNHLHIADPPVVASSLPRKCYFMAKEDLWHNKWSRFWVENFGAFPIKRDGFDRDAIRLAEEKLKQGFAVIMFPEGGRSRTGALKKAEPGAALIASRMNLPIVPVAITGSDRFYNLWWCFWHRPSMTVTFGKPFNLPENKGRISREQRQAMIDYMMKKIAELLPPEYQGVYAAEKTGNH
jgi:1-acyl-sn-glycerol-3-phosphate acyltransferase